MKIVADCDLPFVADYFSGYGELTLKPGRRIERADLWDADMLLVRSVTRVDKALLEGTRVQFVGTVTAGVDHLDTAWLEQAGILWRAATAYNAIPVAEYVVCVVASLMQQGRLAQGPLRAGIVGVGAVGSRVAAHFKTLGFEVFLSDPPRAEKEKNFHALPLALLPPLDLLSLHTPLITEGSYPTYHLLDAAFLKTGSNTVLINSSRGAVVDSKSLAAFKEKWSYCFDVWEGEPELEVAEVQAALRATPHLAGYSVQCRYRGIQLIYKAACEAGILPSRQKEVLALPTLKLDFHQQKRSWQEVVLALFDPFTVTQEMKALFAAEKVLLKGSLKCATLFDHLRQQYIGEQIARHEFAATTLTGLQLDEKDREILIQFGMTIKE